MNATKHNQQKSLLQLILESAVAALEHIALLQQMANTILVQGHNFNHTQRDQHAGVIANHDESANEHGPFP
jgi:hypothetical protein